MKNEKQSPDAPKPSAPPKPEQGAESQLHNYNVQLTRLGDLFGDDEEPESPESK